jgi:hypothetical protein
MFRRRSRSLSGLVILILVTFAWFARNSLPERTSLAANLVFAQSILRSLERPGASAWLDRVTALLKKHPEMVKHLLVKPTVGQSLTPGLGYYNYFKLTFPQFANGAAGGVSIKSTIILINNGGATATGDIKLRQDGWVMNTQTNLGWGNTFNFILTAGQTLRLETDGAGALMVGWAEVSSDAPISGSAKFTMSDAAGHFLSEVGIGDSVPAEKLMIVVDTTSGKNSGYAVCNPSGDTTANMTLELRKMDGSPVASATKTLYPQFQMAEFVTQTFPGATTQNFKGVLVISSSTAPISVITLRTQSLNYTSFPAVPEVNASDTAEDLLFARLGDGVFGTLKLQTTFYLQNNSDDPVNATVHMYSAAGGAFAVKIGATRASEFAVTVPAGGAVELATDGSSNPPNVGWARVTCDKPLGGGAAFTVTTVGSGALQAEVGVPASPPTPMPAIYVDETANASTAIALTNPIDEAVTVRLRLSGHSGSLPTLITAEKQIQLAGNTHIAAYVPELFSDVPAVAGHDFSGCLEAESWITAMGEDFLSDVASLTLLSHGTYLTSAPVADYMVNFGPRTLIRPATLLEGTAPAFRMDLRQLAGEIPMRNATITLDKGSVDFSKIADGRSIGQVKGRIQIFLLMGQLFVVDVNTQVTWADFCSLLTIDGVSEWEPFWARVSNVEGGGVKFELFGDSKGEPSIDMAYAGLLDLLPNLIRLPSGPGTVITVTEKYTSDPFYSTPDAEFTSDLVCERTTTLTLSGLPSGAPRVNSVTPSTVIGGEEVTLDGANFVASTSGNSVTVEGNSRVAATVLQATATQLVVRLPEDIRTGNLRVTTGGKDSNDYRLEVLFAPVSTLTLGSHVAAASTPVRLDVAQRAGEIALDEIDLAPSEGEWITTGNGLSPGTVIGSAGLTSPTDYDLKVNSSDSDKLIIDVIKKGATDAAFQITLSKSASPSFQFKAVEGTYSLLTPQTGAFVLNFTTPVFKNPTGAGKAVTFNTELFSLPRRTMVPETRLTVERQFSYATQ